RFAQADRRDLSVTRYPPRDAEARHSDRAFVRCARAGRDRRELRRAHRARAKRRLRRGSDFFETRANDGEDRLTRLIFRAMKRLLPLFFVLIAATIFAKDEPTHESIWLMKRVGSPQLSPDGRWVVVSVTEPTYDEKEQPSDLWLAPADGSAAPRRITFTKGSESDATWSPDSRRIAL